MCRRPTVATPIFTFFQFANRRFHFPDRINLTLATTTDFLRDPFFSLLTSTNLAPRFLLLSNTLKHRCVDSREFIFCFSPLFRSSTLRSELLSRPSLTLISMSRGLSLFRLGEFVVRSWVTPRYFLDSLRDLGDVRRLRGELFIQHLPNTVHSIMDSDLVSLAK